MTFDFYLGGFFNDHSYRIVLRGSTLYISDYAGIPEPEYCKTVTISNNMVWLRLIEFVRCIKWKRSYSSEALDGTQFEIKIKDKGININSYGSNAYPEDFDQFLTLLNKVIEPTGVNIQK